MTPEKLQFLSNRYDYEGVFQNFLTGFNKFYPLFDMTKFNIVIERLLNLTRNEIEFIKYYMDKRIGYPQFDVGGLNQYNTLHHFVYRFYSSGTHFWHVGQSYITGNIYTIIEQETLNRDSSMLAAAPYGRKDTMENKFNTVYIKDRIDTADALETKHAILTAKISLPEIEWDSQGIKPLNISLYDIGIQVINYIARSNFPQTQIIITLFNNPYTNNDFADIFHIDKYNKYSLQDFLGFEKTNIDISIGIV